MIKKSFFFPEQVKHRAGSVPEYAASEPKAKSKGTLALIKGYKMELWPLVSYKPGD